MTYTALAALSVLFVIGLELVFLKSGLLRKPSFYLGYLIVVFFQLLTNGYLTKNGIVLYNPQEILGIRVAYAPLEDLLFGFSLVVLTMAIWVKFSNESDKTTRN